MVKKLEYIVVCCLYNIILPQDMLNEVPDEGQN
jgi:hypothetical protein